MSSIPTKQLDGDVAIGRNVTAGGNADIQGYARVGHNLTVEGWLEAKNIRSCNKGIFPDVATLNKVYPEPHDGWFAGVIATDADLTAMGVTASAGKGYVRLYVGSGGKWISDPARLYEITVDVNQLNSFEDRTSAFEDAIATAQSTANAAKTAAANAQTAANTAQGTADGAKTAAEHNRELISDLQTWGQVAGQMVQRISKGAADPDNVVVKVRMHNISKPDDDPVDLNITLATPATESAAGAMTAQHVKDLKLAKGLMATKGHANGLAPLDADKHVPDENIAPKFFDVLMFDSVVYEEVTVSATSSTLGYGDEGAEVVYSDNLDRFLLRVRDAGVLQPTYTYFNNFRDSERYGTPGIDGVCPVEGKIYIEGERGYPYVWYDLMLFHIDNYAEDLVDALESTKGRANGLAPLDANTMIPAEHIPATFRNVAHFAEVIDSKPGAVSPDTAPGAVGDDEVDVVFCEASKRFLFRYTPADGLGRLAYFCKIDGWKNFGESADENGVIPSAGKLYVNDKQGDALYWHGNALRPLRPAIKESDDIHTTIANPGTAGQSVQLNLTEAARKSLFCDLFNAAAGSAGYAKFTNGVWDCKLNGLTLSYDEAVATYEACVGMNTIGAAKDSCFYKYPYRTTFPIHRRGVANAALMFGQAENLEVVTFYDPDNVPFEVSRFDGAFNYCGNIHTINGVFNVKKAINYGVFYECRKLRNVQIAGIAKNFSILHSPLLTLASVDYLITNAANGNTAITITVHADVYAKLTGDTTNEAAAALTADELSQWQALLTKAAGKHIAFASA